MSFISLLFQGKTFFFFAIVFSLVYLVPETLIPKKKMRLWALIISLAYLIFSMIAPFFLYFFSFQNR